MNQVGTTTSPFCPGVAGVWANAGGYWTVSLNYGPPAQQVTATVPVKSNERRFVIVNYIYNPPQEPGGSNQNKLHIVADSRIGGAMFYYNGVAYRPDEVSGDQMKEWVESTGGVVNWTSYDQYGTRQDWTTQDGECVSGDCP